MSLQPERRFSPTYERVNAHEFRLTILRALVLRNPTPGPVREIIESALSDGRTARTEAIYREVKNPGAISECSSETTKEVVHGE